MKNTNIRNTIISFITLIAIIGCNPDQETATDEIVGGGDVSAVQAADYEIENAIQADLQVRDYLDFNNIDLSISSGIVTFEGEVSNLYQKQRVEEIAKEIRGVEGVINHIEVQDAGVDDDDIEENIETALEMNPVTEEMNVDMMVSDGNVNLTGEVGSYQEKQLVEDVVMGVKGVVRIVNNLNIDYKTDNPDEEIKEEIKRTLANDIRVNDALIDVSVNNGMVTLSGIVGSALEKDQATADAWVSGVQAIDADSLLVESWSKDEDLRGNKYARKSDSEIEENVSAAFEKDPLITDYEVDVKVNEGTAVLTGKINNLSTKKHATKVTRNIVGVMEVDNFIKVIKEKDLSDRLVEKSINAKIKWNPYLERFDIKVSADKGRVYLSGDVDTYFERRLAEKIAETVNGVSKINNYIHVNDFRSKQYFSDTYFPEPVVPVTTEKYDDEIAEDIEEELRWSTSVDVDDISVKVENALVILTGIVDTRKEKYYAELNAYEGGAMDVNNKIKIKRDGKN